MKEFEPKENKMTKIDMSTMTTLTNEVEKIDDMAREFNSSLNNLLYEIVPVIRQLVNERNDRIDEIRNATEPTGDFAGSLATLMSRVDELENTDGGMAVMKLQDSIDECDEVCGNHEERIDELENDIQSIERRLDDAEVTITI
tara:strand:+ start:31 stop:459 length:429 start_codon:yes stop_codon:yes gene_type:complete